MKHELYHLIVPSVWVTKWNHLQNISPDEITDWDSADLMFIEDISYFEYIQPNGTIWHLDIGFYPENSPEGVFRVFLIKNNDWDTPNEVFETRELKMLAKKVESLFLKVIE